MWPFKKDKKGWIGIISMVSEQGDTDIIEFHNNYYETVKSNILTRLSRFIDNSTIIDISSDIDLNNTDLDNNAIIWNEGSKRFDEYIPNENHGISAPNDTYSFKIVIIDEHKYKTTYIAKLFNLNKTTIDISND